MITLSRLSPSSPPQSLILRTVFILFKLARYIALQLDTNSNLGIRIKTISGDTGSVKGVTYKSIVLSGITEYGIIVNQAYDGTAGKPTTGVPITDFILDDISGSVESGAYELYIECGDGSCSDWTWTDVSLSGSDQDNYCLNVPSGIDC